MSDVACSPIFALDDRSATKVVKEEYFFQLGELIKRSGLDSKVKVERRGSGTVISIEEAYDAFSHHEKDDVVGTPDLEGQFATQQREGFAGMYRVVQKEPCRVQWGKGLRSLTNVSRPRMRESHRGTFAGDIREVAFCTLRQGKKTFRTG